MRSTNPKKRRFIKKKYSEIDTFLKIGKRMSESKMAIEFKIERTLVSGIITKIHIVNALSKDVRYSKQLEIANRLPISFYKALTLLKKEDPLKIQEFFLSFGSLMERMTANTVNIAIFTEVTRLYKYKKVKTYTEYLKITNGKKGRFDDSNLAYIFTLEQKILQIEKEKASLEDRIANLEMKLGIFTTPKQQKLNTED